MSSLTTKWWSIPLPSGWRAENKRTGVELYDDEGGDSCLAAVIVLGKKDKGDVSDDDLNRYAKEQVGQGLSPTIVQLGQLEGLHFNGGSWFLRNEDHLVIARVERNNATSSIESILRRMKRVS